MSRRRPSTGLDAAARAVVAGLLAAALGLALFAAPRPAAAASATAKLDQKTAAVGSAVTLTITVAGVRSVERVQLPALPAFDVVDGRPQVVSGWAGGRPIQQVVLTYYLYPKQAGSFTIGGIGVVSGGATLWTAPLALEVVTSKAPTGDLGDHFLDVFVEPERPYAGQPIAYRVRFGFATSIKEFERVDPDWGGLLEEPSLEPDAEDSYEVVGGRTYRILEWRIPLFSLRPGTYEIGALTTKFYKVVGITRRTNPLFNDPIFDQFFTSEELAPVELESEPVTVEVLPLPEAGRPDAFSGLVGEARLRGELSRASCQIGESVSLTLQLRGGGNLQVVPLELDAPEGLKVYPEEPQRTLLWGSDGPYGTVTRRFDLVPLTAGEAIVPAIEVAYFDPTRGRYETTKAGPFRLSVDGGEGEAAHGAHSADLLVDEATLDELTREPYPALQGAGHRRLATPARARALAVALVAPAGSFGALVLLRHARRRRADPERQRRERARRDADHGLERAARDGAADPIAGCALAEAALRGFLAERAGVTPGAKTPEELSGAVREAGVGEETAAALQGWLSELGAMRYAGRREPGVAALVERARALLARLDEELS